MSLETTKTRFVSTLHQKILFCQAYGPETKSCQHTFSQRCEARRDRIQSSVNQQNRFSSYSTLINTPNTDKQKYKPLIRNLIKDLEGFDAFERSGRALSGNSAAVIVAVGHKTGLGAPHQIGGVRLSDTKGTHKS